MTFPSALVVLLVFATGIATGWALTAKLFDFTLMHKSRATDGVRHDHLMRLFHRHPYEYAAVVWAHVPVRTVEDAEAVQRLARALAQSAEPESLPDGGPFGSV